MGKEFRSTQKYLLLGPRKIRLVVGVIKKMKPTEAVEKLPFIQKRAAGELAKVIKNAIAQAKNQGVSETDLVFKEIQIGEGPRLKRGNPVSRGMWHPITKRMSHIRVVLMTNPKPQSINPKESQKSKAKSPMISKDSESEVKEKAGKEVKS